MSTKSDSSSVPPEIMAEIRSQFLLECDEHLAEFESGLLQLQAGSTDWEIVNAIFRAAHSIKGGAATFGLDRLVRFAHDIETILAAARAQHVIPDGKALAMLLRAGDVLADFVREARDGTAPDEARIAACSRELAAAAGAAMPDQQDFETLTFQPIPASLGADGTLLLRNWIVHFRPHREFYATANEPLVLLKELQNLGDIKVVLDEGNVPPLAELDPTSAQLRWTITLSTTHTEAEILRAFEFVEDICELRIAPELEEAPAQAPTQAPLLPAPSLAEPAPAKQPTPANAATSSIRVDLEKVDRLINLVSELAIREAALTERVLNAGLAGAHASAIAAAFEDLRHLTRDLQDYVMGIRAQPVKVVFQRMPRLVREVGAHTGKSVQLACHGEETEVDRALIEGLTDAMTHMIRNAIDHGIEKPERRLACGKPAQAQVKLNAAHRGGRVVIEISDDGAGIDRGKVLALAVSRGLIASTDSLAPEEIDNLIFEPGLSTAEKVTDLSGRGVGMDVVRRSVQSLGGRVTVSSTPGAGTQFTLSLPLTLAVMDGMMATVCGQSLVVPLTALLETIQVQESNVRRLGTSGNLLTVHGKHVPMIDLGQFLGYGTKREISASCVALLVEDDAGEKIALLVDDVPEQRQIVIKSVEANYRRVPGIAAATILGNGAVALILDINAITASRKTPSGTETGVRLSA
ncbi:MAG TPA: chemotaxis protein CheA [Rhizomicrobium sp.]|nr:chemotaxis protein CheA [Rhizomicrobium sp.]